MGLEYQRVFFFFQAEDGIRDSSVTGVQTCALSISSRRRHTRFKCDWSSDVCSSDLGYTHKGLAHPEYLLHTQPSSSPANPLAKLAHLWHSDPAYRVFFLALATVLISGLVCLAIISNLFKAPSSTSQGPDAHQTTGISAPTLVNIPTPMPTPTPSPTPII